MLGAKKIIILGILDRSGRSYKNLTRRIMDHQNTVSKLLKDKTCLVGRKTQELTGWKGKKLWVLTKKRKWKRNRLNTSSSIDDVILHAEDDAIYVLGGSSVAIQLEAHADEFMIWSLSSSDGNEEWSHMVASNFTPVDYRSENSWSFAHYRKNLKQIVSK